MGSLKARLPSSDLHRVKGAADREERIGGEGEIRTHGTLAGTPVFETGPIGHSGTSPIAEGPHIYISVQPL